MPQLLATLFILFAAAAAAQAGVAAPATAGCWQRLEYGAGNGWLTGRTTLEYSQVPPPATLIARGGARALLAPAGSRVVLLRARFEAMQSRGELDSWYLPGSGQVLATRRLGQGRESRLKLHQFTADGVLRERRQPIPGAGELPPERWPVHSSVALTAPEAARRAPVSTSLQLLEQAVHTALDAGATGTERIVFTDRQWYAVRLLPGATKSIDEDFTLSSGGSSKKVHRRAAVRPVRIDARLLGAGPEHEPFTLLEMDGELTVFVDPEFALPVRIQGNWMRVGSMPVDLAAASLPATPCPAS